MRASGSVALPESGVRGGFVAGDPLPYMERNLHSGLFHAAASLGIAESADAIALRGISGRINGDARPRMQVADNAVDLAVSLEPPLIAICPSRRSFTWSRMRRCGRFGVNVLAAEHAGYVHRAASPQADRFAGIDHAPSDSGVPRILSAVAFLDCEPIAEHVAGDHWIVLARVHDVLAEHRRAPLVFSDGTLGSFAGPEARAPRRPPRR